MRLYDYDISDTIAVDQIFDCYITEGDLDGVFMLLDKHSCNKDIIRNSIRLYSLFSYETFVRATPTNKQKLIELSMKLATDFIQKVEGITNHVCNITKLFLYQILFSHTNEISVGEYNKIRNFVLDKNLKSYFSFIKHPHAGYKGSFASAQFDKFIIDKLNIGWKFEDIVKLLSVAKSDIFKGLFLNGNIEHSLFSNQLRSIDVFSKISNYEHKYYMLSYLKAHMATKHIELGIFIKGLLFSNEDINVKAEFLFKFFNNSQRTRTIYMWMPATHPNAIDDLIDAEYREIIDSAVCYEDLAMQLQFRRIEEYNFDDIVLYLLSKGKYTILKTFVEVDNGEFNVSVPIKDVIEYLIKHNKI